MKTKKWTYDKPDNLVELMEQAVTKFGDNRLFGTKNTQGDYEWVTYREVGERINNLRGGLATLGIGKDDAVGIIANNRTEWLIGENATQGLLGRWVPMYESELRAVWMYIVKDAKIKVLFVSKPEIYEKVKDFIEKIKTLEKIFIIEGEGPHTMAALEKIGKENPIKTRYPSPDHIAVLLYTSGTTGEPKGVLLSHGNLTVNCKAGYDKFPELNEEQVSLSHLPWAHSYGLTAELHNWLQFGGSIGFVESRETFPDDILKVRPTSLISVPSVFNKIYNKIHLMMNEKGGVTLKLFNAAVKAAKKKYLTGKGGFKYKLLDKIVLSKIRSKFGGRLKFSVTASAKMNIEIATFFFSLGIPCYDCYGLTETSPAITMNCTSEYKLGTIGKPVMKTTVVIDKSRVDDESGEGEIIAYGPQVMHGYHNKPKKTKEVMVEDPELGKGIRTGDRGKLDEDGYLWITGRFKEEYKLLNGKYVCPAEIEESIKLIPYITNAFVYGDGKEYNVALIVPDFNALESLFKTMDIVSGTPKELIKVKRIQDLINIEIKNRLEKSFAHYEIPRKYIYIDKDFTIENGMLTQTLKVKREKVLKTYWEELEKLYAAEET